MRATKLVKMGFFFLGVLTFASILAPWIVQDPYRSQVSLALAPPSAAHVLGMDSLGRDLAARLLYGARVSLLVGFSSALVAFVLGTLIGGLSAYFGGLLDRILMRMVDIWYAIPSLLTIILLKELIEQGDPQRGLFAIVFAIGIYSWMHVARIVRGEVLRLKELAFVEAAQAQGAHPFRVLIRHLLPNTWGVLLVALTMRIPLAILAESMLGFIGLGIKSPMASWGSLASEGWTAMRFYPHLIVFPSLAIFLTILCFQWLGEGLQDTFGRIRA